MRRYTEKEIIKIKTLRLKHKYTYAHIARITGIPQTTLGHWFRADEQIPRNQSILLTNIKKREVLKSSEEKALERVADIDTMLAKILSAIMYWCEGSKYPSSNVLTIVNSDPELVYTFIWLLRKAFILNESKFTVHLQIHTSHDFHEEKKFWSTLLQINANQFIKPTITNPNGKKHRNTYHGTCTVKYHDFQLQLKLIGLYEMFAKKSRSN